MLNAYWEPLRFELPPASLDTQGTYGNWRRWIDTALPSPDDIVDWQHAPDVGDASYLVQPRSVAFLVMPLAHEPE
jgi:glycogen operon protein